MALSIVTITILKVLLLFGSIFGGAIGATIIVVCVLFFCEEHFNNIFLELTITIISAVIWCYGFVCLMKFIAEKLSH